MPIRAPRRSRFGSTVASRAMTRSLPFTPAASRAMVGAVARKGCRVERAFGRRQRCRRRRIDDGISRGTSRRTTLLAAMVMTGARPKRALQP